MEDGELPEEDIVFGNNVAGVIDKRKVDSAVSAWKKETKNNIAGVKRWVHFVSLEDRD